MSNVILNNTAAQICQTLSETYTRLTGSYSGPLYTSPVCDCGFLIKNGNGCSGLYIANCGFDFYSNNLDFSKSNTDLNFIISNGNDFIISTSTSKSYFLDNGSLLISDCCKTNLLKNGLQVGNLQPNISLIDSCSVSCQGINFYNSNQGIDFSITNLSNSEILVGNNASTTRAIQVKYNCILNINDGNVDVLNASGCYLTIGCSKQINTGYNFYVNGYSFFNKCLSLNCGFLANENSYISGTGSSLTLDGILNLKNNTYTSGLICSYNTGFSNFCALQVCTGNLSILNVTSCATVTTGLFTGLIVNSNSEFCGSVIFRCPITLCNGSFCSLCVSNYTGLNTCISGILQIDGKICINPTGNTTHVLNGQCLIICTSGANNNLIINSYPSFRSGFYSSGFVEYSGFNSYSTGRNGISGSLSVCGNITSAGMICGYNLSGACGDFTEKLCSLTFVTSSFCQTNSNLNSCFLSSGLNVAFNCQGCVNARNTAKAWGVFCMVNGIPQTPIGGYNVCNIVWNSSACQYSIFLNCPISCGYSMAIDLYTSVPCYNPVQFNFSYNSSFAPLTLKAANINCVTYSCTYTPYLPINTSWATACPIYGVSFAVEGLSYCSSQSATACLFRVGPGPSWINAFVSFIIF